MSDDNWYGTDISCTPQYFTLTKKYSDTRDCNQFIYGFINHLNDARMNSEFEFPQLAQAEHAIHYDIKNSNAAFLMHVLEKLAC